MAKPRMDLSAFVGITGSGSMVGSSKWWKFVGLASSWPAVTAWTLTELRTGRTPLSRSLGNP